MVMGKGAHEVRHQNNSESLSDISCRCIAGQCGHIAIQQYDSSLCNRLRRSPVLHDGNGSRRRRRVQFFTTGGHLPQRRVGVQPGQQRLQRLKGLSA